MEPTDSGPSAQCTGAGGACRRACPASPATLWRVWRCRRSSSRSPALHRCCAACAAPPRRWRRRCACCARAALCSSSSMWARRGRSGRCYEQSRCVACWVAGAGGACFLRTRVCSQGVADPTLKEQGIQALPLPPRTSAPAYARPVLASMCACSSHSLASCYVPSVGSVGSVTHHPSSADAAGTTASPARGQLPPDARHGCSAAVSRLWKPGPPHWPPAGRGPHPLPARVRVGSEIGRQRAGAAPAAAAFADQALRPAPRRACNATLECALA